MASENSHQLRLRPDTAGIPEDSAYAAAQAIHAWRRSDDVGGCIPFSDTREDYRLGMTEEAAGILLALHDAGIVKILNSEVQA